MIYGKVNNPREAGGDLVEHGFAELEPLLARVMTKAETAEVAEMAVAAQGLAKAAQILAGSFTLVATNVPYLGRGKQDEVLKAYCQEHHPAAKADLATCFVERCIEFCTGGGCTALVTPQNWLFLGTYRLLREELLDQQTWNCAVKLGPNAFQDMNWWASTTALVQISRAVPAEAHRLSGIDVSNVKEQEAKASLLAGLATVSESTIQLTEQAGVRRNPDSRVIVGGVIEGPLLRDVADCIIGMHVGDNERFCLGFWEVSSLGNEFRPYQVGVLDTQLYGGRSWVVFWPNNGQIHVDNPKARVQGNAAWGKWAISVRLMGSKLPATTSTGELFEQTAANVVPKDPTLLPALWLFCTSDQFRQSVRRLDQKVNVTSATLGKVPFDKDQWLALAQAKFGAGFPKPSAKDPTQWLFDGWPAGVSEVLHVAVARLVGYRWPRQTGSSFPDCPALGPDGLESHADRDGIVTLDPVKGELRAAARLTSLLAYAFGSEWSAAKLGNLLAQVDFDGRTLDDWLRDGFFEQHCAQFYQRPFVWHIWDGRRDGFHALVNYHALAASDGEGRRTLEKLLYSYLGDWIDRQRADQKTGIEGADARVAAAEHLKTELTNILAGEPPYDIFVRWKPLAEQPIGWEPEINDGVRMNIRPIMRARPLGSRARGACILRCTPKIKWDKDRGKEPTREKADFPWFWGWDGKTQDFQGGKEFDGNRWNDLHYSRAAKLAARERAREGKS